MTLEIFGPIDAATPGRVADALRAAGKRPLEVVINSPGGSVAQGLAAYDLLRSHAPGVDTRALGLCASMASVIFQAGRVRRIEASALVMIHNVWCVTTGDAADHRSNADLLDKLSSRLRAIYAERTGRDSALVQKLMDQETWLSADEAVAEGFADLVVAKTAVKAAAAPVAITAPGELPEVAELLVAEVYALEAKLTRERELRGHLEALCGVRGINPVDAVPVVVGDHLTSGVEEFRAACEAKDWKRATALFAKHREAIFAARNRNS
jgi:ATP-dependent Clp endopeptidase proteolytic subunit ClpP